MTRKLLFLGLFLPSLAFAGGTISTTAGTGTIGTTSGTGSIVWTHPYNPPGAFQITAASTFSLTASWNAVTNPSAPTYTLQMSTASNFTGTVFSSVTAFTQGTVIGLSVNIQYFARVKADYSGVGDFWTQNITSATLSVLPLSAASTWTVNTSSLSAVWARGDNPANFTSYTMDISTVNGFASGTTLSSTTFMLSSTFTALTVGTTYYGRVLSTNITGLTSSYLLLGSTNTLPQTAPTLVQSSCTTNTVASHGPLTLTFNSAVTVGNMVGVGAVSTGETFASVTDNKSNTYTGYIVNGAGNGSARAAIYAATATTAGSSFAVTWDNGAGINTNGCIVEWTLATTSDGNSTANTTGTNPTTGNITTTGSTDFCLGIMSHSSAGTAIGQAGTLIGKDEDNTTHQTYSMQYTTPAAGTNPLTWTTSSVAYVTDGACFK